MATLTFAELKEAVRTEMQLDPGLISDVERARFINDCLVDLGGLGCFEKEVSLSFENGIATVPSDFVELIALLRSDVHVRPANILHTTEGYIPRYPTIELRPATTESLTLWYAYAPAMLVNSGDVPDIPYGFDNAIVDYAVARAHRKNGNIGLYREYMAAYNEKKNELYQRLTRLANSRVGMVINTEETETDNYADGF